jgi:hypothetical protein
MPPTTSWHRDGGALRVCTDPAPGTAAVKS